MDTIDVVKLLVFQALSSIATLQGELAAISKQLADALAEPQATGEEIKAANDRAAEAEAIAAAANERAFALQQRLEALEAQDAAEEAQLAEIVTALQEGLRVEPVVPAPIVEPVPVEEAIAPADPMVETGTEATVPGASQSVQPM